MHTAFNKLMTDTKLTTCDMFMQHSSLTASLQEPGVNLHPQECKCNCPLLLSLQLFFLTVPSQTLQ